MSLQVAQCLAGVLAPSSHHRYDACTCASASMKRHVVLTLPRPCIYVLQAHACAHMPVWLRCGSLTGTATVIFICNVILVCSIELQIC